MKSGVAQILVTVAVAPRLMYALGISYSCFGDILQ
jgi:hypothetical protein